MDNKDKYLEIERMNQKRYSDRFNALGVEPRTLGWGCREDQIERYEQMVKYIDFNNSSIVDLGCGFADFYMFLKSKGIICKYIGVDINQDFIDVCRSTYDDAEFILGNILTTPEIIPDADYVISNGTLNLKHSDMDNWDYTRDFMTKAFAKASKSFVFDFISTEVTESYAKEDFIFYHDPRKAIDEAFNMTNSVRLIHNYRPIPQVECMMFLDKKRL